jgi:hypothetical protein
MKQRTQAYIENQLTQREEQVKDGTLSNTSAFADMEEWVIELGGKKAQLNPTFRRWLWYDRLHDEWVDAGCGIAEGILINFGGPRGLKLLPKPGPVDEWCVYHDEKGMNGPVRMEGLYKALLKRKATKDVLVWSTQSNDWLEVLEIGKDVIVLRNEKSGIEYEIDAKGQFTEAAKKGKKQ